MYKVRSLGELDTAASFIESDLFDEVCTLYLYPLIVDDFVEVIVVCDCFDAFSDFVAASYELVNILELFDQPVVVFVVELKFFGWCSWACDYDHFRCPWY